MNPITSPDCRDQNHQKCPGDAWDEAHDHGTACQCVCHNNKRGSQFLVCGPGSPTPSQVEAFIAEFKDDIAAVTRSVPGSVSHSQDMHTAAQKRFTAAELSAEYHANEVKGWLMAFRRPEFYNVDEAAKIKDRSSTFLRFGRLPHYDEAAS